MSRDEVWIVCLVAAVLFVCCTAVIGAAIGELTKECGQQVSTEAASCPQCGGPHPVIAHSATATPDAPAVAKRGAIGDVPMRQRSICTASARISLLRPA
jgi:hypothetical protein